MDELRSVASRLRLQMVAAGILTTGGAVGRQFLAIPIEDYWGLLDWTAWQAVHYATYSFAVA